MIRTRAFVGLGIALALLGMVVGLQRELGLAIRASSALASVIPGDPPTPLALLPAPRIREATYRTDRGTPVLADVYLPSRTDPGPALILMPGVLPDVRTYAPLVNVADGFARAGFAVLVPEGLDYQHYRVLPEDIDALVAGFEWLAAQPEVDGARVGFVGFSVGGSLALVAAADPRIADEVALVTTVGAYYSLDSMLQAVTTRHADAIDGTPEPFQPDDLAWLVVRNTVVGNLPDRADWEVLFEIFSQPTPDPDVEALARADLSALSPAGRATFDLFVNRDPAAAARLTQRLRARLPGLFESFSPAAHVDAVKAPVHLLHERSDQFVPFSESIRLERAFGGEPRARLALIDILQHVEISAPDLSLQTLAGAYLPGLWALFTFSSEALGRL